MAPGVGGLLTQPLYTAWYLTHAKQLLGPLGSTWSRALLGHTPARLVLPAHWARPGGRDAQPASSGSVSKSDRRQGDPPRELGFGCTKRGRNLGLDWVGGAHRTEHQEINPGSQMSLNSKCHRIPIDVSSS